MKHSFTLLIFCLVFGSIDLQAETAPSLEASTQRAFPKAIADLMTFDLPMDLLLWTLHIGPHMHEIPARTLSNGIGYLVRKTCNDYQDTAQTKDWQTSALCGLAGGALKYSVRSELAQTFDYVAPILGACDAGAYEATSHSRSQESPTLEFVALEIAISSFQHALIRYLRGARSAGSYSKRIQEAVGIGLLVSGFTHTTVAWYNTAVADYVRKIQQNLFDL
ncbi:MAG: hypothetical protein I8H75_02825 [Myxococcaceae bacterium]|nr:hypothetical protein [Myxococcaceae bacterium]